MKEHQKIRIAATLHTALNHLSGIEAILEQPSDFHEIVCDDVPPSSRTAIRGEVRELRRIIESMFERFALSAKEASLKRSVVAYAMLTEKDVYELATRFQGASGELPEDEAHALATYCVAIREHLERIIRDTT